LQDAHGAGLLEEQTMLHKRVVLVTCSGLALTGLVAVALAAAPPKAASAKGRKGDDTAADKAPAAGDQAAADNADAKPEGDEPPKKVVKTDAEWRKILTPMQFRVTRKKATELAGTGIYAKSKKDGIYRCVCCGQPLFDSKTKFESGTGWPSFYEPLDEKAVTFLDDTSDGTVRTEVECSRCDAHLGHVFEDGPKPTGLRFCMNSASLKFVDREGHSAKDAKGKDAKAKSTKSDKADKSEKSPDKNGSGAEKPSE
jgi:peptide-methionine (R)-S-oxide reductase